MSSIWTAGAVIVAGLLGLATGILGFGLAARVVGLDLRIQVAVLLAVLPAGPGWQILPATS